MMVMQLPSRTRRTLLLVGCFLLLLRQVCPWEVNEEHRRICMLNGETGRGNLEIPRWYYETMSNYCLKLPYRGSEGNANNFASREACEKTCQTIYTSRELCLLPVNKGDCKDVIPRWYYNRNKQTCEKFNYSGCFGNPNNFGSKEECEKFCQFIERVPKECRREPRNDSCIICHKRYSFDLNTMTCQKLCYGGCQGKINWFKTESSCMRYCLPEKSIASAQR